MLKEKLMESRKAAGKTQKEIAAFLGVQPSTYSCYESGKREPDPGKLRQIALFLNVSVDYLLDICDPDEIKLLTGFRALNAAGRKSVMTALKGAMSDPDYKKESSKNATA